MTSDPIESQNEPVVAEKTASMPPMSNEQNSGTTQATVWERWSFTTQFVAALGVGGLVLFYLIKTPESPSRNSLEAPAINRAVEPLEAGMIRIDPASALATKLATTRVAKQTTTTPLLRVTGSIVASLRPVGEDRSVQWQFNNPEVLSMFFDWGANELDVEFFQQQLGLIEELSKTQIDAQRRVVERAERLVAAGTDSRADYELARAELLEREITARQAIRAAQIELRKAERNAAVFIRQLELNGLDPRMLTEEVSAEVDLVIADVPEEFKSRVRIGQSCEARFIGMRDRIFSGKVRSISGVLSPERRSLRVLFFVDDPNDLLRPGMFAEIGLGTDPRDALLIPAESLIHLGADDYVLVQSPDSSEAWQVTLVEIGDNRNGQVEILSGLAPGAVIISKGAMLLQPAATVAMRNLQNAATQNGEPQR
ncbi:efflux RND transporter periplasmic adaptor subunit [Pirellulaceae bacterium SH449]